MTDDRQWPDDAELQRIIIWKIAHDLSRFYAVETRLAAALADYRRSGSWTHFGRRAEGPFCSGEAILVSNFDHTAIAEERMQVVGAGAREGAPSRRTD
jgi:hypothetical protein